MPTKTKRRLPKQDPPLMFPVPYDEGAGLFVCDLGYIRSFWQGCADVQGASQSEFEDVWSECFGHWGLVQ